MNLLVNAPTRHPELLRWIDESAALCGPDNIVWIDGTESQKKDLQDQAVKNGEILPLNEEKLPGCFYHRSHPNDVARSEQLTFICTTENNDAGPTNNWMPPQEAYRRAREIFSGSMKGRTMYVIPFSMGPVGSSFSKIGVQVTDSIYVVLNMLIMTRAGRSVLDRLGERGEFTRCLHGKADLNIERRLILHFPEDNAIWSVGSGYGGNALLGKKCLALRIASYLGKKEGWLAEHMLILGVEEPNGRTRYVTAAFPSACGKTNLAMMIPPEGLRAKGYKIWTVGDDIAWLKVGADGGLWAVNPEAGFFGVGPGTNSVSNPNAVAAIQKNTIYTNVALKPDGTVWWEGADGEVPQEALDWRGQDWHPHMADPSGHPIKAAHPNSRFTASAKQCPSVSPLFDDPKGVPISAILFGGRRASLHPLVCETFNWAHGVYTAATVSSELTAAQEGTLGKVRRDPMAMLPFCGYHMGDYFRHWLDMGQRMARLPKIFHVNWFRTDEKGNFLWPGFGENLRVIEWILARCEDKVPGVKTPIGLLPRKQDIDLTGLDLQDGAMEELLSVDRQEWLREQEDHVKFLERFGARLPEELWRECEVLKQRLEG